MKYKRDFVYHSSLGDLLIDLDYKYASWRVVNVFYDKTFTSYVAVVEREVE